MPAIARRFRSASISSGSWIIVAVAGVLLLGAHLLPLPQNGNLAGLPTICPFKTVAGYPCPGCGLTRSLVFAAHGDWTQAFLFHPLGAPFYFGAWAALALGVLSLRFKFRPVSQRAVLLAGSTFAASLLVFWIVRLTGTLPYPPNF